MPPFHSWRVGTQLHRRRFGAVKKGNGALVSIEDSIHFRSQTLIRLSSLAHEHVPLGGLFFHRRFKEIPYLTKSFGCHFFILYSG
jgi:hypothetical protein